MTKYKIINHLSEITLGKEWKEIEPKDKEITYQGRRYRIIVKEKKYTYTELFKRALQGIWMVVRSCGRKIFSKKVKKLFCRSEVENYALDISKSNNNQLQAKNTTLVVLKSQIINPNLFPSLPRDVFNYAFTFLEKKDLARCCQVEKKWAIAKNSMPPKLTVGKDEWTKIGNRYGINGCWGAVNAFGSIEDIPPLPKNIGTILNSACPFFQGKKVKETHMLVLIPSKLNKTLLTLKALGDCISAWNRYYFKIEDICLKKFGKDTSPTHWALMTKYVIPNSTGKCYAEQAALLAQFSDYELPSARDVMIAYFIQNLAYYIKSVQDSEIPSPLFTICRETLDSDNMKGENSLKETISPTYVCGIPGTLVFLANNRYKPEENELIAGLAPMRKLTTSRAR